MKNISIFCSFIKNQFSIAKVAFVVFIFTGIAQIIFPKEMIAQECNSADLYDAVISAYHQTLAKKTDGTWAGWGQVMSSNGTSAVLSPQDINATNYPAMTGTPLLAATGSGGSGADEQSVILTTSGLFVWGKENIIVSTTFTSSTAFQSITVNGNTSGLPAGVLPTDVNQLFATKGVLSLVTNSGSAYVLLSSGVSSSLYGDGSSSLNNVWHQVKLDASTNLTGVIALRGQVASSSKGAMVALCYDGTNYGVYTWGPSTYLGNATDASSRNFATAMTIPTGTPKMIGCTGGSSAPFYFISFLSISMVSSISDF
jgi:hypothetical protein